MPQLLVNTPQAIPFAGVPMGIATSTPASPGASASAAMPPQPPQGASDIFSISDQALADRLQFVEEIGFGNWGSVWLCRPKPDVSSSDGGPLKPNDTKIAVKLVHRSKTSTTAARVRSLWNEMKVVSSFKHEPHPSIIPFYSFIITPSYALITMACHPRLVPVEVHERHAKEWFRSLLSGVDFLHKRGVVHNDIKPANILLSAQNVPVLVDFGFAERYDASSSTAFHSNLSYGTPEYLSPERARGLPHDTRKSDVWSLGITFFEILIGRTPFEYSEGEQFSTKEDLENYWARTMKGDWVGGDGDIDVRVEDSSSGKGKGRVGSGWKGKMSEGLEKLLKRMVVPSADLRSTAAEAMKDAYWAVDHGKEEVKKKAHRKSASLANHAPSSITSLNASEVSKLLGIAASPSPWKRPISSSATISSSNSSSPRHHKAVKDHKKKIVVVALDGETDSVDGSNKENTSNTLSSSYISVSTSATSPSGRLSPPVSPGLATIKEKEKRKKREVEKRSSVLVESSRHGRSHSQPKLQFLESPKPRGTPTQYHPSPRARSPKPHESFLPTFSPVKQSRIASPALPVNTPNNARIPTPTATTAMVFSASIPTNSLATTTTTKPTKRPQGPRQPSPPGTPVGSLNQKKFEAMVKKENWLNGFDGFGDVVEVDVTTPASSGFEKERRKEGKRDREKKGEDKETRRSRVFGVDLTAYNRNVYVDKEEKEKEKKGNKRASLAPTFAPSVSSVVTLDAHVHATSTTTTTTTSTTKKRTRMSTSISTTMGNSTTNTNTMTNGTNPNGGSDKENNNSRNGLYPRPVHHRRATSTSKPLVSSVHAPSSPHTSTSNNNNNIKAKTKTKTRTRTRTSLPTPLSPLTLLPNNNSITVINDDDNSNRVGMNSLDTSGEQRQQQDSSVRWRMLDWERERERLREMTGLFENSEVESEGEGKEKEKEKGDKSQEEGEEERCEVVSDDVKVKVNDENSKSSSKSSSLDLKPQPQLQPTPPDSQSQPPKPTLTLTLALEKSKSDSDLEIGNGSTSGTGSGTEREEREVERREKEKKERMEVEKKKRVERMMKEMEEVRERERERERKEREMEKEEKEAQRELEKALESTMEKRKFGLSHISILGSEPWSPVESPLPTPLSPLLEESFESRYLDGLPQSGNESSLSLLKQSIKMSIDGAVRLYKSSAMVLGRSTNSTHSIGAAGLDGSMSVENEVEDEVRRETGGVEDQLDRMTLWIRNVEKVVEDARQNFANSSTPGPIPPLPVAPTSRPRSRDLNTLTLSSIPASTSNLNTLTTTTNPSTLANATSACSTINNNNARSQKSTSRIPRRILHANQIFVGEYESGSLMVPATCSSSTSMTMMTTTTVTATNNSSEAQHFKLSQVPVSSGVRKRHGQQRSLSFASEVAAALAAVGGDEDVPVAVIPAAAAAAVDNKDVFNVNDTLPMILSDLDDQSLVSSASVLASAPAGGLATLAPEPTDDKEVVASAAAATAYEPPVGFALPSTSQLQLCTPKRARRATVVTRSPEPKEKRQPSSPSQTQSTSRSQRGGGEEGTPSVVATLLWRTRTISSPRREKTKSQNDLKPLGRTIKPLSQLEDEVEKLFRSTPSVPYRLSAVVDKSVFIRPETPANLGIINPNDSPARRTSSSAWMRNSEDQSGSFLRPHPERTPSLPVRPSTSIGMIGESEANDIFQRLQKAGVKQNGQGLQSTSFSNRPNPSSQSLNHDPQPRKHRLFQSRRHAMPAPISSDQWKQAEAEGKKIQELGTKPELKGVGRLKNALLNVVGGRR